MTISEVMGAEVLLWLVGFQQGIKNLVRGCIVFIVQMIVPGEFCVNVIPLYSVEMCPFAMALQYLHILRDAAQILRSYGYL